MVRNILNKLFEAKICGLDTMIFIYLLEKNPRYFSLVEEIFKLIEKRKISAVTSIITPIEIISSPLLSSYPEKIKLYLEFFSNMGNLLVEDLTKDLIEETARLRRRFLLRTPDAIQLATAIRSGAKIFLTNDEIFKKTEEIKIFILDEIYPS